jgi:nucleotidyltransferase substrate binding protein (TIGR01987 family)
VEQLGERLRATRRALDTLAEALGMPFSVVVRDAAIQRFEYSFESLWKLLRAYLEVAEGIVSNSPKQCFREGLKVGLLAAEEAERCLEMTDDRNLTSHTYIETIAAVIFGKLPAYQGLMNDLWGRLQSRLGPHCQ